MSRRISIMELKDILERLRRGQSINGIKRELKRRKTVIRKVKCIRLLTKIDKSVKIVFATAIEPRDKAY